MPNELREFDRNWFSDVYRDQIFWIWYRGGKMPVEDLFQTIPPNDKNQKPSKATLFSWVREFFNEKAEPLDEQIQLVLAEDAKNERVEMLNRHAQTGKEMQNIALEYLQRNKDKLGPGSAVRLWVEGLRVERESRGLPSLITEIHEVNDEKIMKLFDKALSEGEFDFDVELEAKDVEKD